ARALAEPSMQLGERGGNSCTPSVHSVPGKRTADAPRRGIRPASVRARRPVRAGAVEPRPARGIFMGAQTVVARRARRGGQVRALFRRRGVAPYESRWAAVRSNRGTRIAIGLACTIDRPLAGLTRSVPSFRRPLQFS